MTIPDEALFVLMSYLDKYHEKQNIFAEIKVFNPEIQTQVINSLINKKWFDSKEIYITLKDYIETISPENQIKIYNKIFEKEKNLDYLTLFKTEFEIMFHDKTINMSHFTNTLTNVPKRDYIVDSFIKNEDDFNKVLDSVLIGQFQNKNKTAFSDFINLCLKNHLREERKLTIKQFCIIIKRCHDSGRLDTIEELLQILKEKDLLMFKEVHNKLQSKPILAIYGSSKMDFTKEPIQKFINYLFNKHLKDELEEKPSTQRNKKI